MAKKVLQILMFLTVVGMLSGFSFADQVSLGESNLGNVQFANNGGTTRMSFTATCGVNPDCISGFGLLGSDVGTYQIWITGVNPKLDPPNAFDIYPVDMTGSTINFSFTLFMGLGNLTGTINAQTITGGSIAPELIGTFTTTSSSGAFVPGLGCRSYNGYRFHGQLGSPNHVARPGFCNSWFLDQWPAFERRDPSPGSRAFDSGIARVRTACHGRGVEAALTLETV